MNASEQARTPELAYKIAQVAFLFQQEFSNAEVDLSPWVPDPDTQLSTGPDSIDLGVDFPCRRPDCQSCSIVAQLWFADPLTTCTSRIIGMQLLGYDCTGCQWRFSTVGAWEYEGSVRPAPHVQRLLKRFCFNVFRLFDYSALNSAGAMEGTEVIEIPGKGDRISIESADYWNASSMSDPKTKLELDLDSDR
ncbi:MAG: hypothetical protein F6K30_12365 [Cyanothece sp. SIO2G6]|nr:hypothetical protein [Cyanothece sp. SIO2G6]